MLILLFACATGGTYSKGDATAGETVYGNTCAGCHGADGKGSGVYPDITGEVGEDDDELADVILNGEGDMPAQDLTDTEVADVIAYMKANF